MRGFDPPVRVKLLAQDRELYVFAESRDRIGTERGMRRRQMKWLWQLLKQLSMMEAHSRAPADEARRRAEQSARWVALGEH